MPFTFRVLLVFIPFLLLFSKQANAVHSIGTEFTYTCTSTPNVYLVKLKIYRDCAGIQFCQNCPTSLSAACARSIGIKGLSGSCNGVFIGNTTLPIITNASAFDVVQLCALEKSICNNCGTRTPGTFTPGVEVFTFEGAVNLSALPSSCCSVELFYEECCRNNANTALANASSISFYSKITLNRCVTPCNNSVVYDGEPSFVFCSGVFQTLNTTAHDVDGDSLSFNLGASLGLNGAQAPYNSPYSPTVPFPYLGAPIPTPPATIPLGIHINKYTGAVSTLPLGNFMSSFVLETKEWRNINGLPTLIGISRRDYQIISKGCPNNVNVPFRKYNESGTLLGVLNHENSDSIGVCEGTQICRTYVALADSMVTDTTNLKWHLPAYMPGASITRLFNLSTRNVNGPRHDSIKFCWTPPVGSARSQPYFLNIEGRDNACPMPMVALKTLTVYVKKTAHGFIQHSNNIASNGYKFTYKLDSNSLAVNPSLTQWYIEKFPNSNAYDTLMVDSVNNYVFSGLGNHKIYVQIQGTGDCSTALFADSFYYNFIDLSLIKSTPINCKGDSTGSIKLGVVGGTAPYQFRLNSGLWQAVDSFHNLLAGTYLVFARDSMNRLDSMYVQIAQPNSAISGYATHVNPPCHNDFGSAKVFATGGTPPFQFKKDTDPFVSTNNFNGLIDKTYTFQIRDSLGCSFSMPVSIVKPTELQLSSVVRNIPCYQSGLGEVTFTATGATPPYRFQMGIGAFQSSPVFSSIQPGNYFFFATDTNGCAKSAYIQIKEPTQLSATLSKTDATCLGAYNGTAAVQVNGGTPPYNYLWRNAPSQNNSFTGNLGAGIAHVTISDSNACLLEDSILIGYTPVYNGEEICAVSTDTLFGTHVLIWNKTPNKGTRFYRVYGANSASGTFSLINTIPYDTFSLFPDTNSMHLNKVWYYQLRAVDSCGNEGSGSLVQPNLYLQITSNNQLNWNNISSVPGATNIKVWRSINSGAFQMIATLASTASSYIDTTATGVSRRYYLEVDLMPNCHINIGGISTQFWSNLVAVNLTGIKETMMPNLFQIYPNPSNGKLQIGSDRNDLEIASIELYNVQGDKVKMISCEAHTRSLNLDLIELANGVYQVVIITPDNTRHNNKLVLNR